MRRIRRLFTSLQRCCVVITSPCACKSERDTDFPQTRNRGKASWNVRELKRLAGKCGFTNCNEMIFHAIVSFAGFARSRLSGNYNRLTSLFKKQWTLQSPKKITQKDVRHFGGNPHGESSSSGVNQVKRDNVWSHCHSVGRLHRRKRCFRRWLNNYTPEKCKYKDSECFNCHLRGHSRSVAMQNHHQKKWRANNMYTTRNKIQKLDCKRTWEMNFLSPFLPWKRVRS